MNDKNRDNLIGQESFKMLLEEFTSEQETHNQSMGELIKTIQGLSIKVASFEEKIKSTEPTKVIVDNTFNEQIIEKGITDIKKLIASANTQPVVKKYQFLLFPEGAYPTFHKIFLSRLFLFVVAMFFIFCSYKFGVHWNDNQQKINMDQMKNEPILNAWKNMYKNGNDKTKRMMDGAYKGANGY